MKEDWVFDPEWIKVNPWMGEWFVGEQQATSIFLNFPEGVPLIECSQRSSKQQQWRFFQAQNLSLFNELMSASNHLIKNLAIEE